MTVRFDYHGDILFARDGEPHGYQASIARATKVTDPRELAIIEHWMRLEQPTLDHLDRRRFNALARKANEARLYVIEHPEAMA